MEEKSYREEIVEKLSNLLRSKEESVGRVLVQILEEKFTYNFDSTQIWMTSDEEFLQALEVFSKKQK